MKKTTWIILTCALISCNTQTDKENEAVTSPQETQDVVADKIDGSEEFKEINFDDLNQLLAEKEGNLSAREVMKLFYPKKVETGEGGEKIELSETVSDNGNVVVTLIHDNQMDDSVKGEKYIMELTKGDDKWTVLSLKKNWKCREGRGHTDWGIALCN